MCLVVVPGLLSLYFFFVLKRVLVFLTVSSYVNAHTSSTVLSLINTLVTTQYAIILSTTVPFQGQSNPYFVYLHCNYL